MSAINKTVPGETALLVGQVREANNLLLKDVGVTAETTQKARALVGLIQKGHAMQYASHYFLATPGKKLTELQLKQRQLLSLKMQAAEVAIRMLNEKFNLNPSRFVVAGQFIAANREEILQLSAVCIVGYLVGFNRALNIATMFKNGLVAISTKLAPLVTPIPAVALIDLVAGIAIADATLKT